MHSEILPLNCSAVYYPEFLSKSVCQGIYQQLLNEYQINEKRKVMLADGGEFTAGFGKINFMDQDLYHQNKLPSEQFGQKETWFPALEEVRNALIPIANRNFQVGVCIYYPDGNSGVGYHSDLVAFGDTSVIASVSLGEEREFHLREKATQKIYSMILAEGSLLIMGEGCQENYEHALPTDPIYKNGRINITFRQYGYN